MLAISPLRQRYAGVEEGLMLVDLAVLAGFIVVALRSRTVLAAVGRRPAADYVDWPFPEGRRPGPAATCLWRGAPVLELSDPHHPGGRHLSPEPPRLRRAALAHWPLRRLMIGAVPIRDPLALAILDAIDDPALIVERRQGQRLPIRRRSTGRRPYPWARPALSPFAIPWRSIRSSRAGEADVELIGIGVGRPALDL